MKDKIHSKYINYVFFIILIIIFLISLTLGRFPVPTKCLLKVLMSKIVKLNKTWDNMVETVIFKVRLPRIISAVLVGASLAVSGVTYQGMFQNPLVSPDILGVSAGAGFGAALGIFFSMHVLGIQLMSFSMGLLSVFLTYLLSSKTRNDPTISLVLVGVLVGTIFTSGTSMLKYLADPYDKLPTITFWLMGSLSSITYEDISLVFLPIIIGIIPLYLVRWRLNVLSLQEEEAKSLGLDTKKLRIIVILCSTLITSAAVSISGMIGWVGLIVPHIARMIVGPNYQKLLPLSILLGSSYLLLVDDIARMLTSVEIPLGILTSTIGAPFFLYLLLCRRGGFQ